ncbi:hypothetical protein [Spirillospora sp. CA-294931]|uniref:hypothetical protein n=1 Tax=Spirillospora sp. CA-294931 TaxID=3240042 RepID=UPI003D8E9E61
MLVRNSARWLGGGKRGEQAVDVGRILATLQRGAPGMVAGLGGQGRHEGVRAVLQTCGLHPSLDLAHVEVSGGRRGQQRDTRTLL